MPRVKPHQHIDMTHFLRKFSSWPTVHRGERFIVVLRGLVGAMDWRTMIGGVFGRGLLGLLPSGFGLPLVPCLSP